MTVARKLLRGDHLASEILDQCHSRAEAIARGADVIIGDGNGTTARPEIIAAVVDAFASAGFTTATNLRFSGGWTVRRLAPRTEVDAIQVEIIQEGIAARELTS